MLSKLIVSSYLILIEISIWVTLLACTAWGAQSAESAIIGGIVGLIGGFVFVSVFFGAFLILGDIRKSVRAIENGSKTSA